MVLPRESAAVSLKYRRWDLNPHGCYPDRILSPVRLPCAWYWEHVAVIFKALVFKVVTTPRTLQRHWVEMQVLLRICCQLGQPRRSVHNWLRRRFEGSASMAAA